MYMNACIILCKINGKKLKLKKKKKKPNRKA